MVVVTGTVDGVAFVDNTDVSVVTFVIISVELMLLLLILLVLVVDISCSVILLSILLFTTGLAVVVVSTPLSLLPRTADRDEVEAIDR